MLSYRLTLVGILFVNSLLATSITEITTVATHRKLFDNEDLMITLYSSSHCAPCRLLKPHFHQAASSFSSIKFCTIDTNTNDSKLVDHMDKLNIIKIPTLIGSSKGRIIFRHTGGLTKEELNRKIDEFLKKAPQAKNNQRKDLQTKIKQHSKDRTPQKKKHAS